jgi:hypothetical protein
MQRPTCQAAAPSQPHHSQLVRLLWYKYLALRLHAVCSCTCRTTMHHSNADAFVVQKKTGQSPPKYLTVMQTQPIKTTPTTHPSRY